MLCTSRDYHLYLRHISERLGVVESKSRLLRLATLLHSWLAAMSIYHMTEMSYAEACL